MKYAIVYSSKTGNTAQLAQAVQATLPSGDCLYFGFPDPQDLQADLIFIGFWTDKGTCDSQTAAFLQTLTSQSVFLFGTAGFGGEEAYFQRILTAVKTHLAPGVTVVGSFMCQGKMPQAVRRRYESMEDGPHRDMLLTNFDRAVSHPDSSDLLRLSQCVSTILSAPLP